MQISKIVRGNDFKLQINVVQPQYLNGGTEFEEYNVSQCTDVHVNLYCTKDQTIIPLEWEIKEGTENVIIAKVLGKWLHSGKGFRCIQLLQDRFCNVQRVCQPLQLR